MMTFQPREGNLLKQALLKGLSTQIGRAEQNQGTDAINGRPREKFFPVIGFEIGIMPIALEYRSHLVNHSRVAGTRNPHVPLEAADLSRMRQI